MDITYKGLYHSIDAVIGTLILRENFLEQSNASRFIQIKLRAAKHNLTLETCYQL